MANLKFSPNGYQDLGAYALLKNVVENGNLIAEDSRPYKVYTALLNQTGTDAPVATVLENTLGDVTWAREDAGAYFAILADAFVAGKTFSLVTTNVYNVETPVFAMFRDNVNNILLNTSDGTTYLDGLLLDTPVEIRVYN